MKKPIKKVKEAYDWNECQKYIEKKYNFEYKDTLNYFKKAPFNKDLEYRNFWNWIVDKKEPYRGSYIEFSSDDLDPEETEEEWVRDIIQILFDEFDERRSSDGVG